MVSSSLLVCSRVIDDKYTWRDEMRKRLRCKRCKEIVKTAFHPELGGHSYCRCNNELWAEFDSRLWEMEVVDEQNTADNC